MDNNTDSNDTFEATTAIELLLPASQEIRYLMAFTYLILSIIGIIPNIILAVTLIKIGTMPKQKVFVLLAEQILISDFCQLSSQLFVAFPLSLFGKNIYEGTPAIWVYNVINFLDTVGYNGVLDFTFLMAVNRLTVFLMPGVHHFLFDPDHIKRTIIFVWSFLLMQITVEYCMRCHKQFTYDEFYFYFLCVDPNALYVVIWLGTMRYQSYSFPIIMFVTYIVLFCYIKMKLQNTGGGKPKNSSQRQRKYEINLVLQAVIISFFLELQTLSFTVLPMIGTGNNRFYSSLGQNIISIMNNSSNPYVYFFFNSQIRAGMVALVQCQSPKQKAQTAVTTISAVK
ncbi:hypothetical protein V3C99_016691 [Haemonchus contortus]